MFCLNIGWWNSSTLRIIKLPNLNPNDMVISLKMKIMQMMEETNDIELIYCGFIMENMEKISSYVKKENSLVFLFKKDINSEKNEKMPVTDLQMMFQKYKEIYRKPGFKERIQCSLKPDFITKLEKIIPAEISNDAISRAIIKDPNLFKSILKPSVLKALLEKHPVLILAVDYLIKDLMKSVDGMFRYPIHLTDDDYSESDDIEIDYNQPSASTLDSDDIPGLSFFLRNTIRDLAIQDGNYLPNNIFENILLDFEERRQANGQELLNDTYGLSSQLQQMHELGFLDDLLNFRALQVAGGNVQQAVEMILNRVIE